MKINEDKEIEEFGKELQNIAEKAKEQIEKRNKMTDKEIKEFNEEEKRQEKLNKQGKFELRCFNCAINGKWTEHKQDGDKLICSECDNNIDTGTQ